MACAELLTMAKKVDAAPQRPAAGSMNLSELRDRLDALENQGADQSLLNEVCQSGFQPADTGLIR